MQDCQRLTHDPTVLICACGVQMRWMWLQTCINIVLAAFSLRELTRVRFWFTRWSMPHFRSRGRSLPPAVDWVEDLSIEKMVLFLIVPTWLLGYGSIFTPTACPLPASRPASPPDPETIPVWHGGTPCRPPTGAAGHDPWWDDGGVYLLGTVYLLA